MNNNNSKIFVNKISKNIDNNKRVYYSIYDCSDKITFEEVNHYDMQNRIDMLFKCSDFVYKKKFLIKTKEFEKEFIIISKSYDYLLCINGDKIFIKDIIDIKSV